MFVDQKTVDLCKNTLTTGSLIVALKESTQLDAQTYKIQNWSQTQKKWTTKMAEPCNNIFLRAMMIDRIF